MCIAIHKIAGVKLDPIVYKNSFNRNDHWAGIAYVKDDKLVVEKPFKELEPFVKRVQELEDMELVIHCRLASQGIDISEENCHPFLIQSEQFPEFSFAIIHNGKLPWRHTKEKSDTAFFVEEAIKPTIDRDPFFFEHGLNRAMMGAFIGFSNKLVIIRYSTETKKSDVFIVNRAEGIEYQGCWFSNMSFTADFSRTVIESDRKSINNWKPVLWVDTTNVKTPGTPGGAYSWYRDYGGYTGPSENDDFFDKTPSYTPTPGAHKDWVWVKGFGWYNNNANYKGMRSLEQYNKWKDTQSAGKALVGEPPDDLDSMTYLSKDEMKRARKVCLSILKESWSGFNPKNCSTVEVAAWAREELRDVCPGLKEFSNKDLMMQILYGEEEIREELSAQKGK